MIHSLAGGVVKEKRFFDFAKVEICETNEIFWYKTEIKDLQVGDFVEVPYGIIDAPQKAKVLRIDKHISEQTAPVSIKKIKNTTRKWVDKT